MVDIRDALRPLVENPAATPRPVDDIARQVVRVRRRRARRRSVVLAVSTVALLALVNAGRFTDGSDNVTEVAPSQAHDADTAETPPSGGRRDPEGMTPGTRKEPAATSSTSTASTNPSSQATAPATTDRPSVPPPTGPHDPFDGLEAEHYDSQRGVAAVTTVPGGGQGVRVGDGGYMAFHDVDFGGALATRITARIAPVTGTDVDGTIEVRLHAADSPPFATLRVNGASTAAADDVGEPLTLSADTPAIGGRAAVYVTFTSSQGGDLGVVDWLRFHA